VSSTNLKVNTGRPDSSTTGEVSLVGNGRQAYLRIELSRDGVCLGCAWADNGVKLRRFLQAALRRCEVPKNGGANR